MLPLALTALGLPVHAQDEDGRLAGELQAVVRVLGEVDADGGSERDVVARIARSTDDLLGVTLELFARPEHGLTSDQEETLLLALGSRSRSSTREALKRSVTYEDPPERRRAALRVYGGVGEAADVKPMARMTASKEGPPVPELLPVFRVELARLLERVPGGHAATWDVVGESHRELLPHLVGALGDCAAPDGLPILERLLHRSDELDLAILRAVQAIADEGLPPYGTELREAVVGFLDHPKPELVEAAVAAAGALEHWSAVPALIEIVDSPATELQALALGALQRISLQSFRASAEMWTSWYSRELQWWEGSETTLERLGSPETAEVVAALQELVPHRLYRHELALALVPLIDHPVEEVSRLACVALGQLGSKTAVTRLEEACDTETEAISEASRIALDALARQ